MVLEVQQWQLNVDMMIDANAAMTLLRILTHLTGVSI